MLNIGQKVAVGIIGGLVFYGTVKSLKGEEVVELDKIQIAATKNFDRAKEVAGDIKKRVQNYQPVFARRSSFATDKDAKLREFYSFVMQAYAHKNQDDTPDALKGFQFESYSEAMVAMLDFVIEDEERGASELRQLLAMAMDFGRFAGSEYASVPPVKEDEGEVVVEEVIDAEVIEVEVVEGVATE